LAPVPVLCCGNATIGGAGKTTLALDVAARLRDAGTVVHCLSRGYGGRARALRRVHLTDSALEVGDEPLLLATIAPTWVGADREAAARAAVAAGAEYLIMDDGLQNPGLQKTLSFLVIDGRTGFGNGHLLPAGPLREPIAAAAARCTAAVLIGEDRARATTALPRALPVLRAQLIPGTATKALAGQRVLAFAGIASPEKFFATLREAGADLVRQAGFPDHHTYRAEELAALQRHATAERLRLVTTAKDAVRLPHAFRAQVHVADVMLLWEDLAALNALIAPLSHPRRSHPLGS
jgi:tetraacyldisaccharide 4'-kinase